MERVGGENTGMPTSIRKVVVAGFIGATIEWYAFSPGNRGENARG